MAHALWTIHWKHLQIAVVSGQNFRNIAFILSKTVMETVLLLPRWMHAPASSYQRALVELVPSNVAGEHPLLQGWGRCLFRDATLQTQAASAWRTVSPPPRDVKQLLLTGCFLFWGPSPEMLCDSVKIPVDDPFVKHSDQPVWHQPSLLHHVIKWAAAVWLADGLTLSTKKGSEQISQKMGSRT